MIPLLLVACGGDGDSLRPHTGRSCDSAQPVAFTAEAFAASFPEPYHATLSWDDGAPDTVLSVHVSPSLDTVQSADCGAAWELFPSAALLQTEDGRLDGSFTAGVLHGDTLGQASFSGNSDSAGVWAPRTVHVDLQVLADGSTTGELFAFYGEEGQRARW